MLGYYGGGAGVESYGQVASLWASVGEQGAANLCALNYAGQATISGLASSFMPSVTIPLGNDFSVSMSPGFGMNRGLVAGINVTGTYTNGDWTVSGGFGANTAGHSIYGGAIYNDQTNKQTFSYYANYFGGGNDNQVVGGLGYVRGDFSFRLENDVFALNGDRWRTAAGEIGCGNFVLGFSVYTNDPAGIAEAENLKRAKATDLNGTNLLGKTNRWGNGAWKKGQTYYAPGYVGIRQGNNITRFGYSNRWVQDRTQNFIHRNFWPGNQNFYNRYDYMYEGWSGYSGYYNPYTLY